MIKKKLAAAIMAAAILAGSTAIPAYANTNTATGQTAYTETAETGGQENQESEIVRDGTEETAFNQSVEENSEEEDNPALTPAGNMTLVDNVTIYSGTKQFLTLTSRDGNFYYLIIDYDKDGNENVHFLNQVDERDLIGLMDQDEAKELEEQLAAKKAEEDARKAALETPVTQTPVTQTPEPAREPAPEPEKYLEIAGIEISQKTFAVCIGLAVIALIGLAGFIVFTERKKAEAKKPDPDADYDEDYGDEIDIPEDTMDDEDFNE